MNRKFYIAGVKFRPMAEVMKAVNSMEVGDILTLKPEPTNKFDPNAVQIHAEWEETKHESPYHFDIFLGYIPKKFSAEVSGLLEIGIELQCLVTKVNPSAKPWEMCEVEISEVTSE